MNAFKTASGSVYSKCVRGQRSDDELGQLMDIFKSNSAEGSTGIPMIWFVFFTGFNFAKVKVVHLYIAP